VNQDIIIIIIPNAILKCPVDIYSAVKFMRGTTKKHCKATEKRFFNCE